MTHIDDDTLVDLALDQESEGHVTDDRAAVREHLAACAECRVRLDAFGATVRLVRAAEDEQVTAPSPDVWDAITAEVDADGVPPPAAAPAPVSSLPTEPPPSTPVAGSSRRGGRVVRAHWLVVAAAVGLLIGLLGTRPWASEPATPTAEPAPITSVPLDTLGDGRQLGRAVLVRTDGGVDLQVRAPSLAADGGYLEVWLINEDLQRMVSVGVLPADGRRHRFPVSQSVLDEGYVVVDVSREEFDDRPEHSGDSLVRGLLTL